MKHEAKKLFFIVFYKSLFAHSAPKSILANES